MHPDTKQIAGHMKYFGLEMLGKAVYQATFSEAGGPFSHARSIVHAAHGAEIIIKARIAQEHPLLIFKTYPKSKTTNDMLNIRELFENGRTFMYSELPEVLWATTGYRIKKLEDFQKFGRLRNGIVHFSVPQFDAAAETLRFAFEVLDPMVWDFWDETSVGHSECLEDVRYLLEQLDGLKINIHPKTNKLLMNQ